MQRSDRRLLIAVDFDGVLHSYTTREYPFDVAKVLDPPVPLMMSWLGGLTHDVRFKVAIFSSRNVQEGGIEAMKRWLLENGLSEETVGKIAFPTQKPPAHVFIDDRAMQFQGRPIATETLLQFKPWNRP